MNLVMDATSYYWTIDQSSYTKSFSCLKYHTQKDMRKGKAMWPLTAEILKDWKKCMLAALNYTLIYNSLDNLLRLNYFLPRNLTLHAFDLAVPTIKLTACYSIKSQN